MLALAVGREISTHAWNQKSEALTIRPVPIWQSMCTSASSAASSSSAGKWKRNKSDVRRNVDSCVEGLEEWFVDAMPRDSIVPELGHRNAVEDCANDSPETIQSNTAHEEVYDAHQDLASADAAVL